MDQYLFNSLNFLAGRSEFMDKLMISFSKKIRYVFFFLLLAMWFQDKFHKKVTLQALISLGISMLFNKWIKMYHFKPRPFIKYPVHLLPPFPSKKNSSFPSKHTIMAFAAATSVLFYERSIGKIMYVCAFLAGLSRIWMGQHYPSDIAGSAFLGGLTGFVVKLTGGIWHPMTERIIRGYDGYCRKMKHRLWKVFARNSEMMDEKDSSIK